jgi:transposase
LFYGSEELYTPPRSNVYIRLNETVGNWGEFCEPLFSCFSADKNGRPADPVVYFKIFLIGHRENIVFDTDLAERIADSLSIREFLGFGPTERTPDHSSIGRVRALFAKSCALDEMLDDVVGRCADAGLVEGSLVATDSVLLRANASLSGLVSCDTGLTVREHLKQARESNQKLKVSNQEFRSVGDVDARIATKTGTPTGMYYKATHVTDAKSQVILAVGMSTADVGECESAKEPLARAKLRLSTASLAMGMVVADAGYDDAKFHAWVEEFGATPVTNYNDSTSSKAPGYTKTDFEYDPAADHYRCPQGKILARGRTEGDRILYTAQECDCLNCPVRNLCLEHMKRRRVVKRPVEESARDRNIARCQTDEGREALKARKTVVEPPFAHMKRHGGLDLISCWTLERAKAKALVAAISWNLMKLAQVLAKTSEKGCFGRLKGAFGRLFRVITTQRTPQIPMAA